jgi:hypothetical protein
MPLPKTNGHNDDVPCPGLPCFKIADEKKAFDKRPPAAVFSVVLGGKQVRSRSRRGASFVELQSPGHGHPWHMAHRMSYVISYHLSSSKFGNRAGIASPC